MSAFGIFGLQPIYKSNDWVGLKAVIQSSKNAKLIPAHPPHAIISPSFLEAEQLVDEQGAARGKSLKEKMLVAWSDDGQALLQ